MTVYEVMGQKDVLPHHLIVALLTQALTLADTVDEPLLAAKVDEALTCAKAIVDRSALER